MIKAFRMMAPFIKKYRWKYIIGALFLIIVDGLSLLVPQVVRQFTDWVQFSQLNQERILQSAGWMIFLGLLISGGRFLWRMLLYGTSRDLEYDLRNHLFKHFLTLDANFYNKSKVGDLMAHATNDIGTVRLAMGPGIMLIVDSLFMTILTIFMMIYTVGIKTALVGLLALPVISIVVRLFSTKMHARSLAVQNSFSAMTDIVQENLSGVRVIKTYGIEKEREDQFEKNNKDYMEKNLQQIKISGLFDPLITGISGISFVIFMIYGTRQIFVGALTLGDFLAVVNYLFMIVWPLVALGMVFSMFQRGVASMERLQAIHKEKTSLVIKENPVVLKKPSGKIVFENVSFHYPEGPEILKDINLKIPEGQTLAILGKTGSGKTTLVSLILRVYDVTKGRITLEDIDIRDLSLTNLRENIAYAPQDNFLFSKSIADNIAFSSEKEVSQDRIEEAAKFADIHEDIMEFSDKYETMVGERGVTLSGGQKQRISIARAYLKEAPVMILDDSLSAVDTETEENILEGLEKITEQTLILISQRISTVKEADHIVVLDEGRIVQRGKHEELLREDGLYKRIYDKQLLEDRLKEEG
ncbi:MAG: ABC transporter ATP-binding protein [Gallicola sp.]|nr:ABC transporter ATP-binding protein [Gallicola sp.]